MPYREIADPKVAVNPIGPRRGSCKLQDEAHLFGRLIGRGDPRHVIVNLSRTDCLDSGFIAGLIILQRMAQDTGASVVLCGLRPTVREVFARTQLYKLFRIAENEQEAVEVTQTEEASAGYFAACLQTNTP